MAAVADVVKKGIRKIDIVTDKERNEDRKDPSLHEALGVVLIGHPPLHEPETGTKEEERYRQDPVKEEVEELLHVGVLQTEMNKRDDGLVENDKERKEALDLFTYDPVKERLFRRNSFFRIQDQYRSQES